MSEHTSGPLELGTATDGSGDTSIIAREMGLHGETCVIGEAFVNVADDTRAPAFENARLWAAAPDLLAACEAVRDWMGDEIDGCVDLAMQVDAAIARARGQEVRA